MFELVLVGIDPLRVDRDAIAAAKSVAPSARLELVTVFPDSEDAERDRRVDARRALLHAGAMRRLEECREEAGLPDADLHVLPSYNPARGIKRRAREIGADLIVLGAAQTGEHRHVPLGDVARGVLHGAPCPVLGVARARSTARVKPALIGVAFDRSQESISALNLAVEIAMETGARLELVEALGLAPTPAIWGVNVREYLESLVGPENDRVRELAAALEVPATGSAVRDDPRVALRALSTRVDLMVCGSRSWGTAGRVAFGSTADHLMHHSPCPVLVAPRSERAPEDAKELHVLSNVVL